MTAADLPFHNAPPLYNDQGRSIMPGPSRETGAPPSYEEAINPNAPPPSYDSLFGRVREAQKTSKGVLEFLKNLIIIILGTLGCTIILGVTIVIPICMIIMGSIYLHECPQGEYIPVYLLVGGIFGIVKQLLHLSARVRQTEEERQEENLRQSPTQTLLNCFMLGWFIIGSVWVYKEYQPNYDPNLGMITVCLCSISLATVVFHTNQRDDDEANSRSIW
ncbi:hypothetical protein JTB14_001675 [Gonioctena quinquepunctata]|nr:hypothetical protein JTB14_001675 [Gonioctena quinquepunctata]